jgi:hypothetical protein
MIHFGIMDNIETALSFRRTLGILAAKIATPNKG